MTELKTLKDLKFQPEKMAELVRVDHIKAEAVKWVKLYQKTNGEPEQWLRIWIMKFFNLTSEDLK